MAARVKVAGRPEKRIRTRGGTRADKPVARGALAPRKRGEKMSDEDLVAFLARKIEAAMNDEDGDLSEVRKENLNYYLGKPYGNERAGYSSFVTREVLETIEWVLPNVLRVFTSGDRVVEFDPVGPDDEAQAEQETDITNHEVLKANCGEGFLALHHWFKDLLMFPVGYIKCYMEEARETDVGTVTGLDAVGLSFLVDDPNVEILEQRSRTEFIQVPVQSAVVPPGQPPLMQTQPIEVFDLKIRTTHPIMQLRIIPTPAEEVLVDRDLTSINLDHADFVCHRTKKSYTKLVEEGFDQAFLDSIPRAGDENEYNEERINRLFYEDENPETHDSEDDESMREFWVHECYVLVDYDGDGLAERRKVTLIADRVADNEETNYQPFVAASAILMPHKHNGLSYVEIVKDLQLLSSTLVRQLLDNIYKLNIRRKIFSEDALTEDGSTMEAMLNAQAEWIPVRGRADLAMFPEPVQSVVSDILPVIQHVAEARKMRSGVSPEVSLDPNVLQEATLGAFVGALEQASMRVEMLVRIIAETGMKQLMRKVHQLLRSHWDIPKTRKIRGEWIPVDPQGWRQRTDLTVNVGLGFNTQQQMLGLLIQLLSLQKEALQIGLADAKKIFNTLRKLVNTANIGDVRLYFNDPNDPTWQPPEPQPDPALVVAEAQARALDAESQRKMLEAQGKLQIEARKAEQQHQRDMARVQREFADAETKRRQVFQRAQEFAAELDIERREAAAGIDNTDADTVLKEAQTEKTLAEAEAARKFAAEGGPRDGDGDGIVNE